MTLAVGQASTMVSKDSDGHDAPAPPESADAVPHPAMSHVSPIRFEQWPGYPVIIAICR